MAHVLKDGHITQAGKYEHLLQAGTELSAIIWSNTSCIMYCEPWIELMCEAYVLLAFYFVMCDNDVSDLWIVETKFMW